MRQQRLPEKQRRHGFLLNAFFARQQAGNIFSVTNQSDDALFNLVDIFKPAQRCPPRFDLNLIHYSWRQAVFSARFVNQI